KPGSTGCNLPSLHQYSSLAASGRGILRPRLASPACARLDPRTPPEGSYLFDDLLQDVRYSTRALRSSPGFAAIAILSLALGIGANTAIFSLIKAVILKTLPVSHPEQLVQLVMKTESGNTFTNPIWEQVRDRQDVFSGAFAYSPIRLNLAGG